MPQIHYIIEFDNLNSALNYSINYDKKNIFNRLFKVYDKYYLCADNNPDIKNYSHLLKKDL